VAKDLDALDTLLGDGEWFSGEDLPTTLDLVVFGSFAPGVFGAYGAEADSGVQALLLRHENLLRFLGRFLVFAFPDRVDDVLVVVPIVQSAIDDARKK
jgi:hypothetical protein